MSQPISATTTTTITPFGSFWQRYNLKPNLKCCTKMLLSLVFAEGTLYVDEWKAHSAYHCLEDEYWQRIG